MDGVAAAEAHASGAPKAHFTQVMARLRVRWSWGWLGEGSRKMALTRFVPPKSASGVGRRWVGGGRRCGLECGPAKCPRLTDIFDISGPARAGPTPLSDRLFDISPPVSPMQ